MAKINLKGLKDLEPGETTIGTSSGITLFENSKNIKLRFTRKQFESFTSACNILNSLSSHPRFNEYIKNVLGDDVDIKSIRKQLIDPILQAREKIHNPEIKAQFRDENTVKKSTKSYFTEPIEMTDACLMLYETVKEHIEFELRHPAHENLVCFTDIRKMLTIYFDMNNLKTPQGTVFTDLLQKLAPNTYASLKTTMEDVEDSEILIPKGDKKTVHAIAKEIAFAG